MSGEKNYVSVVKPLLDKIAALMLLIVCAPIGLFLTVILVFTNKGKALFSHNRIGKGEKQFRLYKFRTMDTGNSNDEVKITVFGKILRKLSLDELPQLINVLKGEMSLVGPRPLLIEYLPYYTDKERTRHHVSPGITGWAQVNGRNKSEWKNRMKDDCYYVKNVSFFLDLRILLLTVVQLFKLKQADFVSQNQETFIEFAKRR